MDTLVRDAQPVKLDTQLIFQFVLLQHVTDNIKLEQHLMPLHVEDAKLANGQDIFQMPRELNAF
jgi:hypothetical protein